MLPAVFNKVLAPAFPCILDNVSTMATASLRQRLHGPVLREFLLVPISPCSSKCHRTKWGRDVQLPFHLTEKMDRDLPKKQASDSWEIGGVESSRIMGIRACLPPFQCADFQE